MCTGCTHLYSYSIVKPPIYMFYFLEETEKLEETREHYAKQ